MPKDWDFVSWHMPTQKEINEAWQVECAGPAGLTLGVLVQPKQGDPTLRKPYEYTLDIADFRNLDNQIKALIKPYGKNKLQCDLVETKSVKYGQRLGVFLLGYRPGLCGDPSEGITKVEWEDLQAELTALLSLFLPGCKPYFEKWNKSSKFQARFDTYIMFK